MSFLKKFAGILLIIVGFVALVTPFTPGAWLMFVGLTLLGVTLEISEDHRLAKWAKRVGFKVRKKMEALEETLVDKG